MSHLSIETLARLMDEAPTSAEASHLELCEECRTELEGLKADAAGLSALPELDPPPAQWYALEGRLVAEGLLRNAPGRARATWFRPALQVAAAVAIFVLGNLSGPPLFGSDDRIAGRNPNPASVQSAASDPSASLASAAGSALPGTRVEAANHVRVTETAYLNALTRYAELTVQTEASNPVARLAALESIVLTTRAALGQAPADPVINGYHLTALAQREATLKQLASTREKTWF